MKRIGIGLVVAGWLLVLGTPAWAHGTATKAKKATPAVAKVRYDLTGQVSKMDLAAGKMSVVVTKGNKASKKLARSGGGVVTVGLGPATSFKGAGPGSFAEGSWVSVQAVKSVDGLMAKRVTVKKAHAPRPKPPAEEYMKLYGTKVGYDSTSRVMSLDWSDADALARQWLAAHGDPHPVPIRVSDSTVFYSSGEQVWVKAKASADGTSLEAVYVK